MSQVEEIIAGLGEELPEHRAALQKEGLEMEQRFREMESEFASIYQEILAFEKKLQAREASCRLSQ